MPHTKEERELLAKMGSERNYNRFLRLNRAVYGAIAKKDGISGETVLTPGSAKLVYKMELKKAGKSTDNIKDQDVPKYKMSEINGEQLYAIAEGLFTEKVDGVDVVNRERVDEFYLLYTLAASDLNSINRNRKKLGQEELLYYSKEELDAENNRLQELGQPPITGKIVYFGDELVNLEERDNLEEVSKGLSYVKKRMDDTVTPLTAKERYNIQRMLQGTEMEIVPEPGIASEEFPVVNNIFQRLAEITKSSFDQKAIDAGVAATPKGDSREYAAFIANYLEPNDPNDPAKPYMYYEKIFEGNQIDVEYEKKKIMTGLLLLQDGTVPLEDKDKIWRKVRTFVNRRVNFMAETRHTLEDSFNEAAQYEGGLEGVDFQQWLVGINGYLDNISTLGKMHRMDEDVKWASQKRAEMDEYIGKHADVLYLDRTDIKEAQLNLEKKGKKLVKNYNTEVGHAARIKALDEKTVDSIAKNEKAYKKLEKKVEERKNSLEKAQANEAELQRKNEEKIKEDNANMGRIKEEIKLITEAIQSKEKTLAEYTKDNRTSIKDELLKKEKDKLSALKDEIARWDASKPIITTRLSQDDEKQSKEIIAAQKALAEERAGLAKRSTYLVQFKASLESSQFSDSKLNESIEADVFNFGETQFSKKFVEAQEVREEVAARLEQLGGVMYHLTQNAIKLQNGELKLPAPAGSNPAPDDARIQCREIVSSLDKKFPELAKNKNHQKLLTALSQADTTEKYLSVVKAFMTEQQGQWAKLIDDFNKADAACVNEIKTQGKILSDTKAKYAKSGDKVLSEAEFITEFATKDQAGYFEYTKNKAFFDSVKERSEMTGNAVVRMTRDYENIINNIDLLLSGQLDQKVIESELQKHSTKTKKFEDKVKASMSKRADEDYAAFIKNIDQQTEAEYQKERDQLDKENLNEVTILQNDINVLKERKKQFEAEYKTLEKDFNARVNKVALKDAEISKKVIENQDIDDELYDNINGAKDIISNYEVEMDLEAEKEREFKNALTDYEVEFGIVGIEMPEMKRQFDDQIEIHNKIIEELDFKDKSLLENGNLPKIEDIAQLDAMTNISSSFRNGCMNSLEIEFATWNAHRFWKNDSDEFKDMVNALGKALGKKNPNDPDALAINVFKNGTLDECRTALNKIKTTASKYLKEKRDGNWWHVVETDQRKYRLKFAENLVKYADNTLKSLTELISMEDELLTSFKGLTTDVAKVGPNAEELNPYAEFNRELEKKKKEINEIFDPLIKGKKDPDPITVEKRDKEVKTAEMQAFMTAYLEKKAEKICGIVRKGDVGRGNQYKGHVYYDGKEKEALDNELQRLKVTRNPAAAGEPYEPKKIKGLTPVEIIDKFKQGIDEKFEKHYDALKNRAERERYNVQDIIAAKKIAAGNVQPENKPEEDVKEKELGGAVI